MELWDLYDEDRVKLGRTISRGDRIGDGEYHQVVHVCIFNKRDQVLIQKRQKDKKSNPNMWDLSVAGSSIEGESSREAAERETREEIGYKIDLAGIRPFFTINFDKGFDDFYLVERNINLKDLTIQEEEVQEIRWASKEEVMLMVSRGEFIDYYFLEAIFDMRKQRGSYRLGWSE